MIHYTCDFCGHPIRHEENRFEVSIEVRLASEEEEGIAPDLLDDPCDAVDWIEGSGLEDDPFYRLFRFDLCPRCQAAFLTDPLARTRRQHLRHFEN